MKTIATVAAAALLMAGCVQTEPKFDTTVTSVQTIDGKKFNIHEGATPSTASGDKERD